MPEITFEDVWTDYLREQVNVYVHYVSPIHRMKVGRYKLINIGEENERWELRFTTRYGRHLETTGLADAIHEAFKEYLSPITEYGEVRSYA